MNHDHEHLPELSFSKIGGQKLRTAIWRGHGTGRPLLFFNGIGANLEIAQPLATALDDRDIITFDMPGIGGSPEPSTPYRPWWVARAAKQILKDFGHTQADVMGVSWGGGAAQQFAIQNRKTTHRLVLVATSPGALMVPGNMSALSKMASPQRYMDRDFLAKNFETLYGAEEDGASKFAQNMTPPTIRGYLYQLGAMAGWSSLPFLPFLPHETLVMAGTKDNIVPLANAQILKFMIPNATMHVVEDGGHLFLLSRAEEVLPILKDFLDAPSVTGQVFTPSSFQHA